MSEDVRDVRGPLDVAPIRFPDFAAELEALMRVELNLDGRDAGSWYYWTVFIVTPDRQPVPLVTFEGLELARIVGLPNGKHFCAGIDLSFPRDYETRAFKQVIQNPITGLMVTVPVSVVTNDPGYVISPQDGWRPRLAERPERPSLNSYWWREGEQGRLQRVRTPPRSFPHPTIEQSFYRFAYADLSALAIKVRTGQISLNQRAATLAMFNKLVAESFTVASVTSGHFRAATRFLDQHTLGLRVGDALHLATASEHGATVFTLDRRLAEAGLALGVPVELLA